MAALIDAQAARSEASTLLTAAQVAARWQVAKTHVYRLTREGHLTPVRIGRYYRYRAASIEAFEAGGGVSSDG